MLSTCNNQPLWEICINRYFLENLRIESKLTREQYKFAIKDYSAFLSRIPTIDDLTKPNLIGFLRWLKDNRKLAVRTANERAGRIRALWHWCCEEGLIDRIPPRYVRLKVPETVPVAWSQEELQRLYQACEKMPDPDYWRALLMWLWCTGERAAATMALDWSMISGNIAIVPASIRKGGQKTATYVLWPEVLEAMRKVTRSGLIFGRPVHRSTYYNQWDKLLTIAKLPNGRHRKTQSMRVSHATWLTVGGQDATASLMHSNISTTRNSYLDTRYTRKAARLFKLG